METMIDREKLLKAIGKAQVANTNTALSFGLMEAHHIILTQEVIPFELAKAHEAKLMTLEDIDRIRNMNLCGTWPFNTPPYLWISKRHSPKPENWICWRDICHLLENRDEKLNRENYGICWRLWTKQPTDEQREATEWITPQRDIDELLKETQRYIPDMLYEELKKAVTESCLTFKKPEETLSECWERSHMVLIP